MKERLTFEEFIRLPRAEQNVRLGELSDHDRFLARMNDWEPNGTTVKEPEMTPELLELRRKDNELLEQFILDNYDGNGKLKPCKGSH